MYLRMRGTLANQLVADSPYVDYSDARVAGEFAAQLGDEHMEAAGVEIAVVAPQTEQHILVVNHFAFVAAQ